MFKGFCPFINRGNSIKDFKSGGRKMDGHPELYHAILEAIDEPVLLCNENKEVVFCNEAAARLFGDTSEKLKGASLFSVVCAGSQAKLAHFLAALPPGEEFQEQEINLRWQQQVRPFQLKAARYHGYLLLILNSYTDETREELQYQLMLANNEAANLARELSKKSILLERKNREVEKLYQKLQTEAEQLTQKKAELEKEMLARAMVAEELARAKKEAEQASALKSEFLANISHEIRNPMNVIIGMAGLLCSAGLKPEAQEYAELIRESAQSLLTILNDILDFSKIEAGRLELEFVEFDLGQLLARVVEPFALQAREKGLMFSWEVKDGVPRLLRGDPTRLRQILVNLLSNALKFTKEGRVTLTALKAGEREGRQVLLSFAVQDTGIGIPREKLDRLFEQYSQVDGSYARKYGGTGLGLAISRRLVALMGGTIGVESEEGKGSTFTFVLPFEEIILHASSPVTAEEAAGEARPAVPEEIVAGPGTDRKLEILLVDDKAANRRLVTVLLEKKGWKVTVAGSGKEALEQLSAHPFDLVLMDIQMPELDGLETTRLIRSQEEKKGEKVPIIAMTAHAMRGDREKFLAAGMDGYISKPIDITELYHMVEQATMK